MPQSYIPPGRKRSDASCVGLVVNLSFHFLFHGKRCPAQLSHELRLPNIKTINFTLMMCPLASPFKRTPRHRCLQPIRPILHSRTPVPPPKPLNTGVYGDPFRSPIAPSDVRRLRQPPVQREDPCHCPPSPVDPSGPVASLATPLYTNLPSFPPNESRWVFPTGTLTWTISPSLTPWTTATPLPPATPQPFTPAQPRTSPNPVRNSPCSQLRPVEPIWTPGTFPPSPWGYPVAGVQLNPNLIPNPNDPCLPQLVWDISQMPSTAKILTGRHLYINVDYKAQATIPGVNEVHIVCKTGHIFSWMKYWGPIYFRKSKTLTVDDIMNAIYTYFQTPLTAEDVARADALAPANRAHLNEAAYKRIANSHSLMDYEAEQGFRRVDCLGDFKRFAGLVAEFKPTASGVDAWRLNLQLVPATS